MIILLFLMSAAIFDWKTREIPVWIYILGGTEAVLWRINNVTAFSEGWKIEKWIIILHGNTDGLSFLEIAGGAFIGVILLILSKMTEGAVGPGDGMLFFITGIYLGFWKNVMLLWGSLLLCSCWGIGLLAVRQIKWTAGKRTEIPFLPFVLPVGIWILML